ncbi:MAG: hypothetical protein KDD64_17100, partial [Bdellovibrionales bacterium]|nr:hypothetical protein [Bdellovibrionales bacterium]
MGLSGSNSKFQGAAAAVLVGLSAAPESSSARAQELLLRASLSPITSVLGLQPEKIEDQEGRDIDVNANMLQLKESIVPNNGSRPTNINPNRETIFVNGMMNSKTDAKALAQEFANATGRETTAFLNLTRGALPDLASSRAMKLSPFFTQQEPVVDQLVSYFQSRLSDPDHPQRTLDIHAHSEGAIIVSAAIYKLKNKLAVEGVSIDVDKRISIMAYGAGTGLFPIAGATQYTFDSDRIAWAAQGVEEQWDMAPLGDFMKADEISLPYSLINRDYIRFGLSGIRIQKGGLLGNLKGDHAGALYVDARPAFIMGRLVRESEANPIQIGEAIVSQIKNGELGNREANTMLQLFVMGGVPEGSAEQAAARRIVEALESGELGEFQIAPTAEAALREAAGRGRGQLSEKLSDIEQLDREIGRSPFSRSPSSVETTGSIATDSDPSVRASESFAELMSTPVPSPLVQRLDRVFEEQSLNLESAYEGYAEAKAQYSKAHERRTELQASGADAEEIEDAALAEDELLQDYYGASAHLESAKIEFRTNIYSVGNFLG